MMRRATIHDVAAKAGVSLATVDRVLNQRPGVRASTIARVEAAARELNYTPDQFAANLAKSRSYRFLFLMPGGDNSFMTQLREEAAETARRVVKDRIQLDIRLIDTFDAPALIQILSALKAEDYEGVAIVAPDSPEIKAAFAQLHARGIHIVTLVSDVPVAERSHFAGIDNLAAGQVAGRLVGRFLGDKRGSIALLCGSTALRDHTDRISGFTEIITTHFPHLRLLELQEGRDDNDKTRDIFTHIVDSTPDLLAAYNVGAGNEGMIKALETTGTSDQLTVIAHELIPQNRAALVSGALDAIICQDPGHEVRSAVRVLKALCNKDAIVLGQERIRIEIYLKENLP